MREGRRAVLLRGVIVPTGDPEMPEPGDDLTGRFLSYAARALVFLSTYLTCLYSIFTFFHRLFDVLFYFFVHIQSIICAGLAF